MAMLTSLLLDDWKSFGAAGETSRNTVPLAPVTLLVGPNASGKSNVLDALRFLQGAAFDLPLADVLRGRWEGQRQTWQAIRGHLAEAAHHGASRFRLDTSWSLTDDAPALYRLAVGVGRDVVVEEEGLFDSRGYLFHTHGASLGAQVGLAEGGAARVALRRAAKGRALTKTLNAHRALLGQIIGLTDVQMAPATAAFALQVQAAMRDAVFLDIRPEVMRDYRPEGGPLGTAGENISPVLAGLDPDRRQDVVDWLSELCAPEVESIDFDRTRLGEVMMFVVERGGRRVSARSMSDGTLRFLGLLVALLTCPEGTLVVLEEPDVGLHPSRIRLLPELFENVAGRRVQILATTHSPTLLAHLAPETLAAVVAFARDPESGDTVCSQLGDLPHFETLRDAENLDHLISTGWVERAL
jgi:hypothetical protein